MTRPTHCAPEGSPIPNTALPVPRIDTGSVTITPQSGGACRGTVLLLHGLGVTMTEWSDGAWPIFVALANWLRADGWQTCAFNFPADSFGNQNTALNADFGTDPLTPPGTRYRNRFLAEWDHVKNYLIRQNGGIYRPTWAVGFSLGGWSALQLLVNRGSDLVAAAAMSPVTQMGYLYSFNPTPVFPALFPGNAQEDAGGDLGIHALDGLTKPVWLGWGEGVEVSPIYGYKGLLTPATAGEGLNGAEMLYLDPAGWQGGVNAPTLTDDLPITISKVLVASVPWDVAAGAVVALTGAGDALIADVYQSRATVASRGYVTVNQVDSPTHGGTTRTIQQFTNQNPGTTHIYVNSSPRDLVDGETLLLWHNASRHQQVTVNGDQSQATIAANGYFLVNGFTPNTDFGPPDVVYFYSANAAGDAVAIDFGPATPVYPPLAQLQDVTTGEGQNVQMQAAYPVTYVGTTFAPQATNLRRAFTASGNVRLYALGDSVVGWGRVKLIAASAAATAAAGGSVSQHGYVAQDHVLTSANAADIQSWVSATLDPSYPRTF